MSCWQPKIISCCFLILIPIISVKSFFRVTHTIGSTLLHCFFFRVTPTLGSTLWQNGPSFQLAGVSKWLMALMCIFDIWFTIVEFILNSLFEKQISCWTSYPYIMIMSKLPKLQLRTRNCQNYRHSVFVFSKFVFWIIIWLFPFSTLFIFSLLSLFL